MLTWQLSVTKTDGTQHTYRIGAPHIVAFERQFGMGLGRAFSEDQKMEHVLWLAWTADKRQNQTAQTFDEYLDTVSDIDLDATANPTDGTQ
jgi:hypothetical protein